LSVLNVSSDLSLPREAATPKKMPIWSKTETAYIAGIIDGEGCIGIYRSSSHDRTFFLQITIVNTNITLLEWMKKKFGCGYLTSQSKSKAHPKNKQSYSLEVSRMKAYEILLRVFPYLIVKKPQANLGIEFKKWQNGRKPTGEYRPYTKQDNKMGDSFIAKSHILNKKGVE
jgi:hypothetical protein